MILRCAIDKQQDHVISIEAVCSRWQELIDKYCLWKDVAGNVYLMINFPPDFQDNFETLPKNKAVNRNEVFEFSKVQQIISLLLENYLNTSELWKNQLNTKVVERMIEDAKKQPKMERNEKYKEALKYSQFFENAFLQHLKKTYRD